MHHRNAPGVEVAVSGRILPSKSDYSRESADSDSTCTLAAALAWGVGLGRRAKVMAHLLLQGEEWQNGCVIA